VRGGTVRSISAGRPDIKRKRRPHFWHEPSIRPKGRAPFAYRTLPPHFGAGQCWVIARMATSVVPVVARGKSHLFRECILNSRGNGDPTTTQKEATVDPTKLLEADHRTVESLFEQIEKAKGDERTPLIDELATSLRSHMELEEQVLYPKMAPVTGEESVQEANTEHELARKTLQEMLALAPDKPGFDGALEAVKAGIEHHVEEEEGELFPKLRKQGQSVLEEVATPFMQKRMELGLPMDAAAIAAASTKEELLAEAQNAGVEGASSMTKEQLAEALVSVMS
jgi:hemerythrin superfamily protein